MYILDRKKEEEEGEGEGGELHYIYPRRLNVY